MSVTLDASNIHTISDCSVATNWSSSHTIANTVDNYREGTSCNGLLKVSDTTGWAKFDYFTQNTAYFDMTTGGKHLYMWINFAQAHFVTSVKLTAEDASGNIGYWNMATTFPGGWVSYAVECARAFDSNNGTDPTRSSIRYLGMEIVVVGKVSGNVQNCWVDYMHYMDGPLIVKGGGVGTEGKFSEIYDLTENTTNAFGAMGKQEGSYALKAPLQIGDNGTGNSYFLDKNEEVVAADIPVASDWIGISTLGNATGTNTFELGEASGTAGINGCIIKSAGTSAKMQVDFSDTNMDTVGVFGSLFQDCGDITFPSGSVTINNISNTYIACGTVIPSTTKTENFLVVAPVNYGLKMIPGHAIKNGSIIDAPNGIWIEPVSADQEFDITNILFTGGNGTTIYDLYSNTTYNLTANKVNGSNPVYANEAGTGTITILGSVSISINVKDQSAVNIAGAYTYVDTDPQTGDTADIVNTTTDVNGDVDTSYSGGASSAIVRIRKYGYKPYLGSISLLADSSTNVTLITDPQQT